MAPGCASIVTVLALSAAACGGAPPSATPEQSLLTTPTQTPIAVINVTLIDVVSGAREAGMTVVTNGDRIVDIGEEIAVPADAVRVDGTGRFVIPGLWDMHAHHEVVGAESADLFVANGVVGTRDMGAEADFILPLRDRINRGELLGPDIVAAGPILDAADPAWPLRRRVADAASAREAVLDLRERGVDFIKVHDWTPRDAFFAIAGEASRLGLAFAGHVPLTVTVEEAATSGLRSIEHLSNYRVYLECSGDAPYGADRCRELFSALAANEVWQTPTIAFVQGIPDMFSGSPLPHAEYASDTMLAFTRGNVDASLSDEALAFNRSNASTSLVAIHDLFAGGNRFLAGCDALMPGFCLHDELEGFTRAGFSPLEALQTATINPARFLGRENTQGAIEVGKRADLVLLDADPLDDIGHTRRITAVLSRGRLLLRSDLDRILASHRRPVTP